MIDDAELLRRYAATRDEAAFAELVRRHLGLVYHAALRQCGGDAHRAEDVAQLVFTDLARKAEKLARRPVLAGWLYTSTRYAAAQAVRTEARRQTREQEAHAMNEILSQSDSTEWERLRPVIDDALHSLGDRDREAVLLRFFEGRAFAEVGAKLFLSEDAARMRVDRALERLRAALARRGITSTSAALGLALAHQAGAAVPAGLAASVTGAALAGVATSGATAAITFMSMTKMGVSVAVLTAGVVALWWQHQTATRLEAEVASLRADAGELSRLKAENARLAAANRRGAEELARAQAAVVAAQANAKTAPAAAAEATSGPTLLSYLKPAEAFVRNDRATSKAAVETFYSAINGGDSAAVATMLVLSAGARERMQQLFATLSPERQTAFGSAEQMVAMMLAGTTIQVAGMQIMGSHNGAASIDLSLAEDQGYRTLRVQKQYASGLVREEDMVFQQTADGWRYVLSASAADRIADELTSAAPSGQFKRPPKGK